MILRKLFFFYRDGTAEPLCGWFVIVTVERVFGNVIAVPQSLNAKMKY